MSWIRAIQYAGIASPHCSRRRAQKREGRRNEQDLVFEVLLPRLSLSLAVLTAEKNTSKFPSSLGSNSNIFASITMPEGA